MDDLPHRLSIIGYWAAPGEPPDASRGWPDAQDLARRLDPDDRAATVRHLNSGQPFRAFSGTSTCRICGAQLGSTERTDGTWAWPDRLEHYVEAHDVLLPEEFVSACHASVPPPAWLDQHQLERWVEGGSGHFPMLGQKPSELFVDDTAWLDWAATRTPPRPVPGAVSIDEARAVCARLSHRAWRFSLVEILGRWRIEYGAETERSQLYLQRCPVAILERCLLRYRIPDPDGILDVPRANAIAGEQDGAWGALRILAGQPTVWFVWVKSPEAEWPTQETVTKLLKGPLAPGWAMFASGGRAFVAPAQDDIGWRWLLRGQRESAEKRSRQPS